MFRDRVVGHYVGRGYRVDTDAVLEGQSGGKHKVDLVATDSLGRLAVWWGDREPFEGPELESVKRAARDLDAAPAIAAPQVTATVRESARRHGVIIVDEALLDAEAATMARPLPPRPVAPRAMSAATAYPPWPDPGNDRPRAATERDPAIQAPWRRPDDPDRPTTDSPVVRRSFDWLHEEGHEVSPGPYVAAASMRRRTQNDLLPAFWGPVLYTAIGLLILIIVLAFVL